MAYDTLRDYRAALKANGQLLEVKEQVKAEPDLAAAANAASRMGDGAPGLVFNNIEGFTNATVALNTLGSWRNHAIALGMDPATGTREQVAEFIRRWE